MIRRSFRALRKFIAPSWLTTGEGELVGYSLDLLKDGALQRIFLGLLSRFPQNGANGETAPRDALEAMGRDRRVVRGIDETDESFAARLTQWLVDRRTAGNPFTLMRQLHAYTGTADGVSFRTVDVRGNWYSRDADGVESVLLKQENWDWDGDTDRWSRFWVIIYPGTLWSVSSANYAAAPDWNTQANGGGVWGVNMSREHVRTLQSLVTDWKPEGTRCESIILAFDPASFDPTAPEPDGNWGGWGKIVAGERVPSRLATARYLNGGVS